MAVLLTCFAGAAASSVPASTGAAPTATGQPKAESTPPQRSGGRWGENLGLAAHRIPVYWLDEPAPQPPGDYARRIEHDGRRRYYELHVPSSYRPGYPMPAVLALHGGGGNPAGLRWQSQLDAAVDEQGVIAIYPAGTHALFRDKLLFWNVGPQRKQRKLRDIDDVAFLEAVLDDAAQFFAIDPERVYSTGISNGSHMAYRMAAESERIAAVAGVAGQERLGTYYPPPTRPVPVIHFHGTQDNWNPIDGATTSEASGFEIRELPSLDEHLSDWVAVNDCTSEARPSEPDAPHQQTLHGSCTDDSEVILWLLHDGGHTWPGGQVSRLESKGSFAGMKIGPGSVGPVSSFDANRAMLDFFLRHRRRGAEGDEAGEDRQK